MELPVSQQMLQLLAAFALGAALGLLFDAFRVLRRRARAAWMRALLDVLYSAAALFALFTFGMVSGAGQVRLFMLAAVAAGCACYGAFASAACLRALEAVAAQLAKARNIPRMSAQAVGGAVAHNPISVIIPCHRVLGSHGTLTGYAGGLDRKEFLLKLEGASIMQDRF